MCCGKNGFREFVRKDIKRVFEESGLDQCLKMNPKELEDSMEELLAKETEYDKTNQVISEEKMIQQNKTNKEQTLIKGTLRKKGLNKFSGYKGRYFVLRKDGWLLYYDSKEDKDNGTIAYRSRRLSRIEESSGNIYVMKFTFVGNPPVNQLFRVLESDNNRNEWIESAEQIQIT